VSDRCRTAADVARAARRSRQRYRPMVVGSFGRRIGDGTQMVAGHEYVRVRRSGYEIADRRRADRGSITTDVMERNNNGALPRATGRPTANRS
jgi:hypothetical protein